MYTVSIKMKGIFQLKSVKLRFYYMFFYEENSVFKKILENFRKVSCLLLFSNIRDLHAILYNIDLAISGWGIFRVNVKEH